MSDLHVSLKQWNEPDSMGGKRHEAGETGDYSHVPDLADLILYGTLDVLPKVPAEATMGEAHPDNDEPQESF